MSNEIEKIEEEFDQGCEFCGTMWYEVNSEGSPCGIDGCDVFTCCDNAWKAHITKCHPNYEGRD